MENTENQKVEEPLLRELTVTLMGADYKIPFPNTGQFIAIENEKNFLSAGTYKNYAMNTDDSYIAVVMIDAFAMLTILVPNFFKNINVATWRDLSMEQGLEIFKMYIDKYQPWHSRWMKKLSGEK